MVVSKPGQYPHIEWLDLNGDGVFHECAIVKRDANGNIYYIELAKLDDVDRTRIGKIVMNPRARAFELWDLMSQITLNNGVNALEYFHQLVKVISPDGVIYQPQPGRIAAAGPVDTNVEERPRRRGRPKKKKEQEVVEQPAESSEGE